LLSSCLRTNGTIGLLQLGFDFANSDLREAWPTQKDWSCHEVMLAGWGMPIGELFDLEALGKHCKETGRYEFFVVSEPVNVPAGVASPPNILAIF
jgi:hypothetical protein